jgi:lysophospholipase L1-like esterase
MKNKLHYSFLLCLTIAGSLLVLSWIPQFSIGKWTFKAMDPLAAIRPELPDSLSDYDTAITSGIEDSIVAIQDSIAQEIQEVCPPGIICIEDYSGDDTALRKFFGALSRTEKTKRNLRIAFYGDSFIEGDVFCGSFRDSLQSIFGGEGVGYVPITSDVAGFRNTIKHSFEGWKAVSLINKKDSTLEVGPSGYCFVPQEGNKVVYKASRQRYLRTFNTINLYYKSLKETTLHYTLDTTHASVTLPASSRLKEWKHKGSNLKSVKFEFDPFDSLYLYGASFENGEGINVDNFSLRGNSGMNLAGIADAMYKDFNKFRNYKLVILQFGLNIVVEDSLNYKAYSKRMVKVIEELKKNFPEASFLLLSVSDRSSNTSGEFKTMNAIPAMRNTQRQIAQKTGIAFWDMYEAMGGENSMVKFSEGKPPLAAKDYTHLNFKGGRILAGRLVKSLLFEKEKYERK